MLLVGRGQRLVFVPDGIAIVSQVVVHVVNSRVSHGMVHA
jgi:hypothetical protein